MNFTRIPLILLQIITLSEILASLLIVLIIFNRRKYAMTILNFHSSSQNVCDNVQRFLLVLNCEYMWIHIFKYVHACVCKNVISVQIEDKKWYIVKLSITAEWYVELCPLITYINRSEVSMLLLFCLNSFHYEKKVYTVMVINSININITNNHLPF
jgi:hypothetical protein